MRWTLLAIMILLTTTATAKTLPGRWDGTCIPVKPMNENHKRNPDSWKGQGYIPPDLEDDTSDIQTCNPPNGQGLGPK